MPLPTTTADSAGQADARPGITSAGMADLAWIEGLTSLFVAEDPGISDVSLTPDRLGPKLKHCSMTRTRATPAGVARLEQVRPEIDVVLIH